MHQLRPICYQKSELLFMLSENKSYKQRTVDGYTCVF